MARVLPFMLFIIFTAACKEETNRETFSAIPISSSKTQSSGDTLDELLRVKNPVPGQWITSPLEISGEARGYWFFEGEAHAELLDGNHMIITVTNTTAVGDWMTEDWVPFTGTLIFETPQTKDGFLVLHKANASDLKEHDLNDTIPVQFQR